MSDIMILVSYWRDRALKAEAERDRGTQATMTDQEPPRTPDDRASQTETEFAEWVSRQRRQIWCIFWAAAVLQVVALVALIAGIHV